MVALETKYLGLDLTNPVVGGASPLWESVDNIKRFEDVGGAAVVLPSLFEEQLRTDALVLDTALTAGSESYAEATSYFPSSKAYRTGPEEYLELIQGARRAVSIPVIASLNGVSPEGWTDYASKMEQAGASAIELNVYYLPTSVGLDGRAVEKRYVDVLAAVKRTVRVPVAMKLSPFFSATANMAAALDKAGADGLVLFNRFYQPDIDLDAVEVVPNLELSTPAEARLPLRWIAILYGHLSASLCATSGVHSAREVVKYVMAGADAVQIVSVLLKEGVKQAGTIVRELDKWMDSHEYTSVSQMKGSVSQKNVADPATFERANYIKALKLYRSPHLL